MIDFLKSYVHFSFENGFYLDFVNLCKTKGISLFDVQINDNTLFAKIKPVDYLKINRVAKQCGGSIKRCSKTGIDFAVDYVLNRRGLVVGLTCAMLLLNFLCGFVWNVQIVGNDKLTADDIKTYLASQGLYYGVYWKKVDVDLIEDLMMSSFDDIAWVHINRDGTTARLELRETTPKPSITPKTITNLKACADGVIVSAMVYDGWQVAQVGDSVKKGDLLVSGIYENPDQKINLYAHGSGEFLAQVTGDFSHTVNRLQKHKVYGKTKNRYTITFFGLNIPLYIFKSPKNSDVSKSYKYVRLNGKNLPFGIINTTIKPYEIVEKNLSDNELYKLMQKEIDAKIMDQYKNDQLISRDIDITINYNCAKASGKVVFVQNIGVEQRLIK